MCIQQVFILVVLAVACAVEARSVDGPILLIGIGHNDIPQRCIDFNITRVSCAHVTSNDALLPHPDDCQLFYYCVSADSQPICRLCPANLHFNPQKHVCDLPEDAGCVLTTDPSTPSEPVSEEPSTTSTWIEWSTF